MHPEKNVNKRHTFILQKTEFVSVKSEVNESKSNISNTQLEHLNNIDNMERHKFF